MLPTLFIFALQHSALRHVPLYYTAVAGYCRVSTDGWHGGGTVQDTEHLERQALRGWSQLPDPALVCLARGGFHLVSTHHQSGSCRQGAPAGVLEFFTRRDR